MKVALCMSGFMRTYRQNFDNLEKYFLSHYPKTDIFIDSWEFEKAYDYDSFVNEDRLRSLYHPISLFLDAPHLHKAPMTTAMSERNFELKRSAYGVAAMYYKIKLCNMQKKEFEDANGFKYDCVIRFRPDIKLTDDFIIDESKLNSLNVPKFGDFGGVNDQFAYGNSEIMDIYSSLYDDMDTYLTRDKLFMNPEILLKHHINKKGIVLDRFEQPYLLCIHGLELDNQQREGNFNIDDFLILCGIKKIIKDDGTVEYEKN